MHYGQQPKHTSVSCASLEILTVLSVFLVLSKDGCGSIFVVADGPLCCLKENCMSLNLHMF